jgi:hypothetical protein
MSRSTKEKDKIFLSFYEKFHPHAMEVLEQEFPLEVPDGSLETPGVKINRSAYQEKIIQYPVH